MSPPLHAEHREHVIRLKRTIRMLRRTASRDTDEDIAALEQAATSMYEKLRHTSVQDEADADWDRVAHYSNQVTYRLKRLRDLHTLRKREEELLEIGQSSTYG
jgi:hypothetical protein